jgi:3-oxoacyl-[acyl-carrier-protein] synthase-3
MAYLRALGCFVPSRVVENAELASLVEADPAWILSSTGIEQRRFAAPDDTVASLGMSAAQDCLASANMSAAEIGMILVSSGSSPRRFPGPAAEIGRSLGIPGAPAIDLPIASAGSLFGIAMAANLCRDYGNLLVVASEIMTRTVPLDASGKNTAILFGDGAGACVVSAESGFARIVGSVLASDGEFAEALRLECGAPLQMDGRTIILQASRKLPRAILEVLEKHGIQPGAVSTFLMHQANLNLITRVAQAVGVPEARFYRNVQRYGNTSSASLLIAATEWWREGGTKGPVVLSAFGAGLHWGAVLAEF